MKYLLGIIILFSSLQTTFCQSNKDAKIGAQTWMSENLNVKTFRNGDPIKQVKSMDEWNQSIESGTPVWCYYDFNPENEKSYGILYNFFAVKDKRGLAPPGWRIPSKKDWEILINFLGGKNIAGIKLKNTTGWKLNGNNSSKFTALPGGRLIETGFSASNESASWWSSTLTNDGIDAAYTFTIFVENIIDIDAAVMWICMPVRCLKVN